VNDEDFLAERFEAHRPHLRAVGLRMLGSAAEAEDAVQEAWFRLRRADSDELRNLGGWLTTVVGRVCLDMPRSRRARREEPLDGREAEPAGGPAPGSAPPVDPREQAVLADSVGLALLVALDTLSPPERLAFVLHDLFAVPFEEIAPIVDRSPAATRQLGSRARRRIQGAAPSIEPDRARRRQVVEAFLVAARGGDLAALLAVLDPEVVLRADPVAVRTATASLAVGAPALAAEVRGIEAVAEVFLGRAKEARPALLDGLVRAVYAPGGTVRSAIVFTVGGGRVTGIEVIADPARLAELEVEPLD
jgi:RNA polymerase sigma-70 factor (ECF subfamily)